SGKCLHRLLRTKWDGQEVDSDFLAFLQKIHATGRTSSSALLSASPFERCLQATAFRRLWIKDDLNARFFELLEIVVSDALKLGNDHPRVCPLAILAVTNGADDGVQLVRTQVLREPRMVEALSPMDGLLKQLPDGITERRKVIAEQ